MSNEIVLHSKNKRENRIDLSPLESTLSEDLDMDNECNNSNSGESGNTNEIALLNDCFQIEIFKKSHVKFNQMIINTFLA
jgi:hypothetical protein